MILDTENGEVYTWGWKECVPSGKVYGEPSIGVSQEDGYERQSSFLTEQGNFAWPCDQNDAVVALLL